MPGAIRPHRRCLVTTLLALIAVSIPALPARADEPPDLHYLSPAGGQQGTTVELEIGGHLDPWPPAVWTDCPGLTFKVVEDDFRHVPMETESSPGTLLYERKGIGRLVVEIAADAPIGRHLVRIYTPYGASTPVPFVVGYRPEQTDQEPNDTIQDAQPISQLPVTINGRLWGDHARVVVSRDVVGGVNFRSDTDTYTITLEAGQWLIASTEAYGLGYPIDTVLDLRDADGVKLAHNHDAYHSTYDSRLAFRAPEAGTYYLQLLAFHVHMNRAFQKVDLVLRDSAVYRLTLSHGPHATFTYPPGVLRGRKTPLQVHGINVPSPTGVVIQEIDLTGHPPLEDHALLASDKFENRLRLAVTDGEQIQEIEPNDQRELAQPVFLPVAVNGRISRPGDKDFFSFNAGKDQQFTFFVSSYQNGYPLSGVLKILDKDGKQLAKNESTHGDPRLAWTAPDEGAYTLCVSELTTSGGGRDYIYRVEMDDGQHFSPSVEKNRYHVQPGRSVDIKFTISRHNDDRPLHMAVEGLPEGVTFSIPQLPIKGGEAIVTLTVAPDAKPSNQPVRFGCFTADRPDQMRDATASVRGLKIRYLRYPEADASGLEVDRTPHIWLTVTPRRMPEPDTVMKLIQG